MAVKKGTATAEEMWALRDKGMSNAQIAKELGVNVSSVYTRIGRQRHREYLSDAEKLKYARPTGESIEPTSSKKDLVIELYTQGLRCKEITEKTGLSINTVYNYISRYNKLNTKPEAERPQKAVTVVHKIVKSDEPVEPVEVKVKVPPLQPLHSTENPYIIGTELYDFAYVPLLTEQLYKLSLLAEPEPWAFADPAYNKTDNPGTTILELYLREIFRERAADFNSCSVEDCDKIILIRDKFSCFHTGLYTCTGADIYMYFEKNISRFATTPWYFKSFSTENAPVFRNVHPLPKARRLSIPRFDPALDTRINTSHILENPKVAERLPEFVRSYWNAPLLLETAIEHSIRKTRVTPSMVVDSPKVNRASYLLPLCITRPDKPDVAAVIEPMGNYHHCRTVLTLNQAYLYARVHARPTADWLRNLVEPTSPE